MAVPFVTNPFWQALRSIFGPSGVVPDQRSLTAATQALINTGPCEVYDLIIAASAAGAMDYQLVDATATATGTTPTLRFLSLGAGIAPVNLSRPIRFNKGLVLSYTASASENVTSTINYGPLAF